MSTEIIEFNFVARFINKISCSLLSWLCDDAKIIHHLFSYTHLTYKSLTIIMQAIHSFVRNTVEQFILNGNITGEISVDWSLLRLICFFVSLDSIKHIRCIALHFINIICLVLYCLWTDFLIKFDGNAGTTLVSRNLNGKAGVCYTTVLETVKGPK